MIMMASKGHFYGHNKRMMSDETRMKGMMHHDAPTYLHADTATDAQLLGQRGDLRVGRHLNAQLAHANHRA